MESLAAYLKRPVTAKDIMMLSEQAAKQFYCDVYWMPMKLFQVNNLVLRYLIFDQAVNRGMGTVMKQLQSILNDKFKKSLKVDGITGDETIAAMNEQDSQLLLEFVYSSQLAYCRLVQQRPNQALFLVGWIKRTQSLLTMIFRGNP